MTSTVTQAHITPQPVTLGKVDLTPYLAAVSDGQPAKHGLVPNKDKVSATAIREIALALPDITLASLASLKIRVAILMSLVDAGQLKSLGKFPYATHSEVQAAQSAGKVKTYVYLPGGKALALAPDGHEYRAGGVYPANCPKHGGDAEGLVRRLTRRTAMIFASALADAEKKAKEVSHVTRQAPVVAPQQTAPAPSAAPAPKGKGKKVNAPPAQEPKRKAPTPPRRVIKKV